MGGRSLPWWAIGISTMATQTSVVSFMSIPAFVALKEGGGLTWLQYELAVPLAMIAVMVLLIPFFRKLELNQRVRVPRAALLPGGATVCQWCLPCRSRVRDRSWRLHHGPLAQSLHRPGHLGHHSPRRCRDHHLRHPRRHEGGGLVRCRPDAAALVRRDPVHCARGGRRGRNGPGCRHVSRGATSRSRLLCGPVRRKNVVLGVLVRRLLLVRLVLRHRPESDPARAVGADHRRHQEVPGAQRPVPVSPDDAVPRAGCRAWRPVPKVARAAGRRSKRENRTTWSPPLSSTTCPTASEP